MLLLHISDIHFQHQEGLAVDPDRPFRTALVSTVRQEVKKLGPVSAILLTGDIAFKGASQEYDQALAWLKELATAAGCSKEEIYVVPGNHDVDRSICKNNISTRNAQSSLAASSNKERELRTQYSDAGSAHSLLAPIAAYNDFAKHFDNNLVPPEKLCWSQDLPLPQGVTLRLHGLTTTFLSGKSGGDDARGTLILTPLQTVLDPVESVVNVVLAHHPPEWLLDSDDANESICERAALHFFGHKHRSRIEATPAYVRYYAGAVNPERTEVGWEPGFNFIKLGVERNGISRTLVVESRVMRWQPAPDRFDYKKLHGDSEVLTTRLPIRGDYVAGVISGGESIMASIRPSDPVAGVASLPAEAATADTPVASAKNLVFRFWTLTNSQRREIAEELRLFEPTDDPKLPESEKYGRVLIRAKERGLMTELEEKIKARE